MSQPETTPEEVIAEAIASVCSDGNSDARRVAQYVLASLDSAGFRVVWPIPQKPDRAADAADEYGERARDGWRPTFWPGTSR